MIRLIISVLLYTVILHEENSLAPKINLIKEKGKCNVVFFIKNISSLRPNVHMSIKFGKYKITDSLYKNNNLPDLYDCRSVEVPYGTYKIEVKVDKGRLIKSKSIEIKQPVAQLFAEYDYHELTEADKQYIEEYKHSHLVYDSEIIPASPSHQDRIIIHRQIPVGRLPYTHKPKRMN